MHPMKLLLGPISDRTKSSKWRLIDILSIALAALEDKIMDFFFIRLKQIL